MAKRKDETDKLPLDFFAQDGYYTSEVTRIQVNPTGHNMTRDELLEFHRAFCEEARALMARKNHDYAGNSGAEPFANFTRVESLGICLTEQGFLVRLTDKLSRLATFVASRKLLVAESVRDTCLDVANYIILFAAYCHQKAAAPQREELKNSAPTPIKRAR